MKRFLSLLVIFLPLSAARSEDRLVRETEALSPEQELAGFTVPTGFEIRLFAAEPMINKPINLAVDERGRLWVSSTTEYPYAAAKDRWSDPQGSRVKDSLDAIKILEDADGDGRADRVIDFADGLNIPTGVLPWHRTGHHDGCIAWSIPNLWYFADTDGDGRADLREVLFGPLGYEKDTHGMISSLRLGSDGWIYATHGFNNTSLLRARDGSTLEMHSGNVFRFRPDASRVELWSRGQVNPFGLARDRRGNLYSADCHSAPIYQLLHGGVYPSFGKPHDGLGFAPAMIEHSHGSTGIAGIAYLDGGIWGREWEDHILLGNPVTSRLNLDRIRFTGTTPHAEEKPDFLTSADPWFRPVDLTLAPDGTLYVADFYNRIIGHYEVPLDHPGRDRERGRIWRITRSGSAASVPRAEPSPPVRPGEESADLVSPDPWVRRCAAQSLVESPLIEAIPALLQALAETPTADTHLRHALRIGLKTCFSLPGAFRIVAEAASGKDEIEFVALAVPTTESAAWLLQQPTSAKQSDALSARRRRHIARYGGEPDLHRLLGATLASTQTSGGFRVFPALLDIAEALEERDGMVRDPRVLEELTRLSRALLTDSDQSVHPAWTASPATAAWEIQSRPRDDSSGEIFVLSSLVRGAKDAEQATGTLLSRPFRCTGQLAFRLCGHRGFPGQPPLKVNYVRLMDPATGEELARADPPRRDEAVRIEWTLPAAAGRLVQLEVVDGDKGSAYAWLGLGGVEGADLPVDDFFSDRTRESLLRRVARLLAATAPVDLRDQLRPYLPPPPPAPPLDLPPAERERLARLVAERVAAFDAAAADPAQGKVHFGTHCSTCHRIGGVGGLVGPQLDGIGSRGLARLAEDILDPNRNVDAHFRLTRIEKRDGTALGGFVASESGGILHLLDVSGQAHRLSTAEIATRESTALSLMPPSFGELLKPEEFRDLIAWLLRQ